MNTLTSNYIKNIKRSIQSLHEDELVKMIYLTSHKQEHFSNGTDFRYLLYNQKEGKHDVVTQYIEDLYSLQTMTAKLNKPIMAFGHGHCYNSGASWLQATGCPTSTLNTRIAFNDAKFGFVPHGGSTYYLSRMQGELGTFLAVTGLSITGEDAVMHGLTDKLVHSSKPFENILLDTLNNLDFPIPSTSLLTDNNKINPWLDQIKLNFESEDSRYIGEIYEPGRNTHEYLAGEEFYEPRDKMPGTVGNSEYQYKNMIERYDEVNFGGKKNTRLSYLEFDQLQYQNYFGFVLDYVKGFMGDDYKQDGKNLKSNLQAINRCFYSSTLEEITENLKRENTPFADKCLKQMSHNSELSMKLALKMVRQALNLDYKGCLLNEVNVSLNKVQDADFELGVSQVAMKPGQYGESPKFRRNITDDEVNSYFEKNKFAEAVNIDVVEKALLPTRFYYDRFSDQVRLWINEESTTQREVREYFDEEVKLALRAEGIDIRDRALTIESARDAIHQRDQYQRAMNVHEQRLDAFFGDEKLQARYIAQTAEEVKKLKDSPELFYTTVNRKIQEAFETAYIKRLNTIFEKSKEIHDLEKRRMYIRFKQFLFQSRILTYQDEEFERQAKKLQSLPFKQIHLTEKWDQSYLKQEHPELDRSVLYHLSKAVGKATLAPVEIAKEYLSNPKLAKSLTHYTFDMAELKNIRKDVLLNTEKYEQILQRSWDSSIFAYKDRHQIKEIKNQEWEYWYRVLNDGKTPMDNVKNYQTYLAYKEFVENVEKKSVDTLKLVVQRLINDFESDEINQIVEFSKTDKQTKRQAIESLLFNLNGQTDIKKPQQKQKQNKNTNQLLPEGRGVQEIKRHLINLLYQDPHLKHFIPMENENKNVLIHKMKNAMLDDLFMVLELFLINNDRVYALPNQVLEQRMAQILSPRNKEDYKKNRTYASLKVLDQYLSDVNAEQTIKAAIQLIKPYFFNKIHERLDEEINKVLYSFKTPQLAGFYLNFYQLKVMSPEIFTNNFHRKLQTFHGEREKMKYIEEIYPEISRNYEIKKVVSSMGNIQQDKNATLQQKIDLLDSQTKLEQSKLKSMNAAMTQMEQAYLDDINAYRDEEMKQSYDDETDPLLICSEQDPQAVPEAFNMNELYQALFDSQKEESAQEFLNENGELLCDETTNREWVQVISTIFDVHGLKAERYFRYGYDPEEFDGRDFTKEMRDLFGGKEDLTFEQVAEYATFLNKIAIQEGKAFSEPYALDNMKTVFDLILRQTEGIDEISKISLFQQAIDQTTDIKIRDYKNLKQEVRDFTQLQQKLQEDQKLRASIESLAQSMPQHEKSQVYSIIDSDSKYLDLQKILSTLQAGKPIDITQVINKTALLTDLSKGKLIEKFLKEYETLPLDVVSIAQARETIQQAQKNQHELANKKLDTKLYANITLVLDFIQESLMSVPNSRRQALSLGEYLQRHQFLNSSSGSFSEFADQILKNKIQSAIGRAVELDKAETIDWEVAGIPSNPLVHEIKNKRVMQALEEGKGFNEAKAMEDELFMNSLEYRENYETQLKGVEYYDVDKGVNVLRTDTQYYLEQVLIDARGYTELKPDFFYIRNQFENKILHAYASPEFEPLEVEELVKEYTNLRIQEALLQDGFRQKLASNDGHLYLKILREEIAKELNIAKKAEIEDFLANKVNPELVNESLDMEGRYNTDTLNNTQAVGYDNFAKRAANPEQNRELAHETIFDKLLSEYFVNKRATILNVNQLIDQMDKQFTDTSFPEGHIHHTKDKSSFNMTANPFGESTPLGYANLKQSVGKGDLKRVNNTDFNEMLELDIAASQALQNNKNGLSVNLRRDLPEAMRHVPEYFDKLDVRKPPAKVVDDKLTEVISEVFEIRQKLEKTFSRNELLAYDRILAKHLTQETLIPKLELEIHKDFNQMTQIQQLTEIQSEGKEDNLLLQFQKAENRQAAENRGIQNEDAMYKFLAFSGMLETTRRKTLEKSRVSEDIALSPHSFDEYVKQTLLEDAKKPARPIIESEYQPTKERTIPLDKTGEGFKTTPQREAAYYADFEKFKDNKKETQERNQLFFILEQFFSKTVEQKEPLNQAQEAIMEYFKDTDNTYFFDRNKLQ